MVESFFEIMNSRLAIAVLTAATAFAVAAFTVREQRRIARRRATIDYLERRKWDTDYLEARQAFLKLRDEKDRGLVYWATCEDLDRSELGTIRNILNDYELIAIGIRQNIYDEAIYHQYWRGTLLRDWEDAELMVIALQRRFNPKIYENFKGLAEAWKNKRAFAQSLSPQSSEEK